MWLLTAKQLLDWHEIAATLLYAVIGLVLMMIGYYFFDKITPFDLTKELAEDQNIAVAIVVAVIKLGIVAIIIAAMV
jgi:uncharacterized membrane protein YjfL (UPF0719 family)